MTISSGKDLREDLKGTEGIYLNKNPVFISNCSEIRKIKHLILPSIRLTFFLTWVLIARIYLIKLLSC